VCNVENIDFEKNARETLTVGYPVLGLVHYPSPKERRTMSITVASCALPRSALPIKFTDNP